MSRARLPRHAERIAASVRDCAALLAPVSLDSEFRGLQGVKPSTERTTRALALAVEAARRTLALEVRESQILSALCVLEGGIVEQPTGEGKTLVVALAAAVRSLDGPVHVVSANTYLAQRDQKWMAPVHEALGLSSAALDPRTSERTAVRQAAYGADITYGPAMEFVLDQVRDDLVAFRESRRQRGHQTLIIDEADAVLLDQARHPVQLLGDAIDRSALREAMAPIARALMESDEVLIDEAHRIALPSEAGLARASEIIGHPVVDAVNGSELSALMDAIYAEAFLHRDREYLIEGTRVVPLDPVTGRALPGRSLDRGMQGAVEAKEGLPVAPEGRTIGIGTIAGLLSRYPHVAGMTGTADEEDLAREWGMRLWRVPPHRPVIRVDHPDRIFATSTLREEAAVREIASRHALGQPVLVGCPDTRGALSLSRALTEADIPHEVLTARNSAHEADIIARAGEGGRVTVVARLAGRGVDIALTDEARHAGGLFVLGLGRGESRRHDTQLIGRSGRQGDPGASQFLLSAEDDLIRNFGGERIKLLIGRLPATSDGAVIGALARAVLRTQEAADDKRRIERQSVRRWDRVIEDHAQRLREVRAPLIGDDPGPALDALLVRFGHAVPASVHDLRKALPGSADRLLAAAALATLARMWPDHVADLASERQAAMLWGIGKQRTPIVEYALGAYEVLEGMIATWEQEAHHTLSEVRIGGMG